jgi:Protein of unknown function (DUF1194)
MRTWRSTIWLFVVSITVPLGVIPTAAEGATSDVDLKLILAVDVSDSMSREELQLQREGYVSTFRDPRVARAIASGELGRIAVLYFEWAGPDHHHVVRPWTVLTTPRDTAAFADSLAMEPIATDSSMSNRAMSFGGYLDQAPIAAATATSISASLLFALEMFRDRRFRAGRQVIDISGNGTNNSGPPLPPMRDLLVSEGIIINGLPLAWSAAGNADSTAFLGMSFLERYYETCVIGGPGAFFIAVSDISHFQEAVRLKLLTEIAKRETLVRPASFELARQILVDCAIPRVAR